MESCIFYFRQISFISSNKIKCSCFARYAALVQEAKMVPIVEPEVLMDGDHDIDKCYEVTTNVLNECYNELEFTMLF